ncbi:MAG: carboxypeptidase regulatory-like domain-containing protein, partial [Bacteroidaceae bacterium]|nr:carboxypeptidase regulatory-like domain-containing protein [Bacteroidaceae bacterium]
MRTIQRYLAVLLLLLSAVSAQAEKLTIVSTVGSHIDLISVYGHNELGSWNTSSRIHTDYNEEAKGYDYDVAAGDSVMISVPFTNEWTGWKYTYMECEGKKIHENGDTYQDLVFIMPDHDVTIYLYAEYDPDYPDLPGNPSPGGWNAATGELTVSGFQTYGGHDGYYHANGMSGTVATILKRCGVNKADVKKVTVMGEIGDVSTLSWMSNGYNCGNCEIDFPNIEAVDLRHTYGLQSYNYSYAFENTLSSYFVPTLKKLILPSNIEQLRSFYWGEYSVLENVTLYASVPPTVLDYNTREHFDKLPAGCILYVPEQSVAAYKADEYWGKFSKILPIPEGDAEDITVDLPDNFTDGRYEGMSLLLCNARTGEQTKYIVDERPSYIFYAQTNEEPYTAQLLSPQGVLIASTDTLTLGGQPMEMTFKTVQPIHTVQLTVQTPAEEEGGTPTDVTDQTTIIWMDAMGNRLGTGSTLARQVEGTRLLYGITLPTDLAARYGVPPRTELLVKEATAQTVLTLSQPDSVILSGKVTDLDGKPVAMANVTASLMMNGTVGKVFTATTNALGRYELTALTGDLTLSASASGYVAVREAVSYSSLVSLASLSSPSSPSSTASSASSASTTGGNFDLTLSPLSGPTIHYDFTYTAATTADEEATTLPYYSDYANVVVAAYNETTGKAIEHLAVAYPEVQLLEGAKAGDRIRLTASSLKDAFMPVEVTVTLTDEEEEKADSVTFALKELGGVEVSFLRTGNQAVTAALYDADGLLCRQETFAEASLILTGLKDGDYTLVTMGSDPLLSKMLYLSDYTAVGMEADKDYVSNKVKVESGIISEVTNDLIPTLYATPFYYTDETKTLFMPNKTEVSTSCNVTLRAEIGFKDDIKERVSNVRLLVDYPIGMAEFVEGSSMTGTKMVRATMEDGHLSIPVEKDYLDEPTRFILTAIDQGTLMASAKVQFDIDGRTVTQPIGVASCDVKYMTIVAPEAIYKLSFPVYGTAPALSPVRVYAGNDILVGETQSLADGSWDMHVELSDCPNLATIPVYAVITTKQGREAKTETVNVTYDQNMIRPLHVLMYPPLIGAWNNPNDYSSVISDAENLCIDFDFENPMSLSEQWYSAYVHTSHPFLFEIILNTTDPTLVKNVVLEYTTVYGEVGYLPAEYDGTTGHWMCSVNLQNDAVCNVDVDFLDETEPLADADLLYLSTHLLDYIKEGFESEQKEMDRILTGLSTETNQGKRQQLFQELAELMEIDLSNLSEETETDKTLDEIFAEMEALHAEINGNLDGFLQGLDLYNLDLGEKASYTHTNGLTPEQLLNEGYMAFQTTDGHTIYQLANEEHYVLVDFENDMRMETKGDAEAAELLARARIGQDEDLFTKVNRENGWLLVMSATISALINEAKQFAQEAHKIFHANWVKELNKEAEFMAKYCTPNSPLLTDKQIKQLKSIQSDKQFQALCADISNQLGNNGLDIHKAPIPVPITKTGIKLQSIMKTISAIGEVFSWIAVLSDCKEGYDRINELESIYKEIPNPCKEDESNARHLRNDVFNFIVNPFASGQIPYFHTLILADVLATETVGGGLKIATATGGTSMSTVLGGILINLTKIAACWVMNETYAKKIDYYTGELRLLNCDEEYRKKQEKWWKARFYAENGRPRNKFPKLRAIIDPSGYVYEAVADNRVENAKATIYFKQTGEDEYGDLHDEVVKWNAEEFRQENPQMTDAEGKYAWDVPQGLWQVKIEKEGYE